MCTCFFASFALYSIEMKYTMLLLKGGEVIAFFRGWGIYEPLLFIS